MLKYQEVALAIEQSIRKQNLAQGTRLPSLSQLSTTYDASKTTMVKALAILEGRGIIFQVQGSGIFVRLKARDNYIPLTTNTGFTTDLGTHLITAKLLEFKVQKPSEDLIRDFNCDPDEDFFFLKRKRYIDKKVLCIENSYFRQKVVPYLNEEIANESIFGYLDKVLNLKVGFSDKYLQANVLTEAEAKLLELPLNAPGFYIDELFYSTTGIPFDFSQNVYHYKNAHFFLQSINK